METYGKKGLDGSTAIDFSLFESKPSARTATRVYAGERAGSARTIPAPRRRTGTAAPSKKRTRTSVSAGEAVRGLTAEIAANPAQVKIVAVAMAVLLAIAIAVVGAAQESKITSLIADKNAELLDLQQSYEAMSIQYDTKMCASAVEEYATNTLGMVKRGASQTEYITLGSGDAFEVSQRTNGWMTGSVLDGLD